MKRDTRTAPARPQSSKSAGSKSAGSFFNSITLAILGGVFVLGIALGIGFSTVAQSGVGNVVTIAAIDEAAPNAEQCLQLGASAIAMDTRVFVTLNPFNVYVSQPKMQPGCVLRQTNWSLLEQKNLVNSDQVNECRRRMNTFGFTGTLESSPQINCIYQNEAAENLFLNRPGVGGVAPENQKF